MIRTLLVAGVVAALSAVYAYIEVSHGLSPGIRAGIWTFVVVGTVVGLVLFLVQTWRARQLRWGVMVIFTLGVSLVSLGMWNLAGAYEFNFSLAHESVSGWEPSQSAHRDSKTPASTVRADKSTAVKASGRPADKTLVDLLTSLALIVVGHSFMADSLRRVRDMGDDQARGEELKRLGQEVDALLATNLAVWREYGPESRLATQRPGATASAEKWRKMRQTVLVPNNSRVCKLVSKKLHLLLPDERKQFKQFELHAQAFKEHALGQMEEHHVRFPKEFAETVERWCVGRSEENRDG